MTRKPTVAFLGPAGTWTHQAVRTFAERGQIEGEYCDLMCENMGDVFEAVDRGQADFGVVPIENSLEGPVTTTLDAFAFTSRAEILGECVLDIHQALILAPGATLDDVTTIASHPQGVGQCRRWLHQNLPGRQTRMASSTAAAAEMTVHDKTIAAIANPLAAQLSGGVVYEEAIEDHLTSQTRFVLIGNGVAKRQGPGKTTLALFLRADRSGALNMILSEFTYADINLSMIQSRPTKRELGDYMFFVEIEGYADDANVRMALDCLRLKLRQVKVIGSYPQA